MSVVKIVIYGVTATTFAVGGGATGAVVANHGVVTSGVIHACYTTRATRGGSHVVVLQNSGTRCPSGFTAITWPAGPPCPPGHEPSAPQNLTASQVPGAVTITWDAPASNGGSPITSYEGFDNGMTVTTPPDVTSATFNDPSVTGGGAELFQIEAINKCGSSSPASIQVKLLGDQ